MDTTRFGPALQDWFVSIIFGNGVFALRGVVVGVYSNFLVVRDEKDKEIVHVPVANILYVKLGHKTEA